MHEHPLQRFFKSLRERPVFAWERYQKRDVLVIDHPLCQAVFSRQGAQLLHFQPKGQKPWLWCAAKWPQVGAIRGGVPVGWHGGEIWSRIPGGGRCGMILRGQERSKIRISHSYKANRTESFGEGGYVKMIGHGKRRE